MKKLESRVYKGKWDLVIFFSPLGRAPNPGGFGNADKMFDKIRLDDLNRVWFPKWYWNGELSNGFCTATNLCEFSD